MLVRLPQDVTSAEEARLAYGEITGQLLGEHETAAVISVRGPAIIPFGRVTGGSSCERLGVFAGGFFTANPARDSEEILVGLGWNSSSREDKKKLAEEWTLLGLHGLEGSRVLWREPELSAALRANTQRDVHAPRVEVLGDESVSIWFWRAWFEVSADGREREQFERLEEVFHASGRLTASSINEVFVLPED